MPAMAKKIPDRSHLLRKAVHRPQSRHQATIRENPSHSKFRKDGSQLMNGPAHISMRSSIRRPSQVVRHIPKRIGRTIGQRGWSGPLTFAGAASTTLMSGSFFMEGT